MGQSQLRASKSIDEDRFSSIESSGEADRPTITHHGHHGQSAPPLAPVFGSPIDSKPMNLLCTRITSV